MKRITLALIFGLGAIFALSIKHSTVPKKANISQNQDIRNLGMVGNMILNEALESEMDGKPWSFPSISQLEESTMDDATRSWIKANKGSLFTPLQGKGYDAALVNSTALILELRPPGGKTLGVTVTGSMKILD